MHIDKKGQATIFVVLGIVVLVVVIFTLMLFKYNIGRETFQLDVSDIKNAVESCNKGIAKDSLVLLGAQSGRYKNFFRPIEQENEVLGAVYVSHFAYGGDVSEFTLDDVEAEINEYYGEKMPECLNYFDDFKNAGFEIEENGMNVNVEFLDDATRFILDYEIIVSKDGKKGIAKEYIPAEIPYRFKKVFDISVESAEMHADTGKIPISYIYGNGLELYNYDVKNSVVYRLIDQKNDGERRYVFYFAAS